MSIKGDGSDDESILRDAIRSLPSYPSGLSLAAVQAETGLEHIAKLDSNENPLGPSPRVIEAATAALAESYRYPDREERALRAAMAGTLGIDPAQLVFSGGSEDVLAIVYRMVLRPGDRVLTVSPGFGLHAICAEVCDAVPVIHRHLDDWSFPVDALVEDLARGARILAISSPSNPVGAMLGEAELDRLLDAVGPDTLVVLDEAYIEFAPAQWRTLTLERLARHAGPWVALRTFAKAYALAGLRIGYGVTYSREFAEHFHKTRSPFNVNAVALAAAEAAWQDEAWMQASVATLAAARDEVGARLAGHGFAMAPSAANFLFIDTGHDSGAAADALRAAGVLVKPWREPGYERFVRACVGLPEENERLISALVDLRSS